jgi:hypothetical protein
MFIDGVLAPASVAPAFFFGHAQSNVGNSSDANNEHDRERFISRDMASE